MAGTHIEVLAPHTDLQEPLEPPPYSEEAFIRRELDRVAGTTIHFDLSDARRASGEGHATDKKVSHKVLGLLDKLEQDSVVLTDGRRVCALFPNTNISLPAGTGPEGKIAAQTICDTAHRIMFYRSVLGAAEAGANLDPKWLRGEGIPGTTALRDKLQDLYAEVFPKQAKRLNRALQGQPQPLKNADSTQRPRTTVGVVGVRTQVEQQTEARAVIEEPAPKKWKGIVWGAASILTAGSLTSCTVVQAASPPTELRVTPTGEIQPTATSRPEPTPTTFAQFGPEATVETTAPYPQELSVEEIQSLLGMGGVLAEGLMGSTYEQDVTTARISWLHQAGFNVDDPAGSDYVAPVVHGWGQGDDYRWDEIAEDTEGNIVGWLQIEDPTMPAGFRYAEGPTWDPNFHPDQDSFTFGLPTRLSPGNRFEVIRQGEFRILVELDSSGNPVRWLNTQTQEMLVATGAENRPEVAAIGAELFDRTTWSERALSVWNNPEAASLTEHQWLHEYLTATARNFLAEAGQENPTLLRTSLEHLVDPPNGARPIVASITPEAFGQMNDREVAELATGLNRQQQLWLLFEYNMALPEAECRTIPISAVDKAAIITDPTKENVLYPVDEDGDRYLAYPWLYEDGVQTRRYNYWISDYGGLTQAMVDRILWDMRGTAPELTFYGYTASELLGTDVPAGISGYITSGINGDLWGIVESPGQITPEFAVRLIDREGNQSLLLFAFSGEPFTVPHASCWCTPRPTRTPEQFIPDIGDGTIFWTTRMYIEPDLLHFRTPTTDDMQHAVGNSIVLPQQLVAILSEGQRFIGHAVYVNGVLCIENFNIIPPEMRAE